MRMSYLRPKRCPTELSVNRICHAASGSAADSLRGLGVSRYVISILATITDQPIEVVVALLNNTCMQPVWHRSAIKASVTHCPMCLVNILVGAVNLGMRP